VVGEWERCYKCARIWSAHPGFDRVRLIVPCSVAVGDSPWYRAVYHYKAGSFDLYARVLSSVLSTWVAANGRQVTTELGRRPDLVTIVPSKQIDHPTPLWEVVHGVPELRGRLSRVLAYRGDAVRPTNRELVISDSFEVLQDVTGLTVVLIEDTWVSGQTPVSAALALSTAGADAVAVIPIARMVYQETLTQSFESAIQPPYRTDWPK
jgi:predicted amidophosphoribosyltransferase